jgi:hypothetical protein
MYFGRSNVSEGILKIELRRPNNAAVGFEVLEALL